jgi:uncharacterized Zn finger protein
MSYGWDEYVSVAERRREANKKMDRLRKKGKTINPINIEGRIIAREFWGKSWCEHFEYFSDFSNRLPRGRTYVRNGSVCHLSIEKGAVKGMVSGSSIYEVELTITPLEKKKWKAIKEKCKGQVGSLLELLTGKLSDSVMSVVSDPDEGLFPQDGEMSFSCDCPDWADMCKHVAAVLYGIGNRLDNEPELLFTLRNVDASELIDTSLTISKEATGDALEENDLGRIFDIEMDDDIEGLQEIEKPKEKKKKKKVFNPDKLKGKDLMKIRKETCGSVADFAKALGVTPASVYRWEKEKAILNLRSTSKEALKALVNG